MLGLVQPQKQGISGVLCRLAWGGAGGHCDLVFWRARVALWWRLDLSVALHGRQGMWGWCG